MNCYSDLDYAVAIQIEAQGMVDTACVAARRLETNDALYRDFAQNALIAYMYTIQREHYDHSEKKPELNWPSITKQNIERSTTNDARRVVVGHDAAAYHGRRQHRSHC